MIETITATLAPVLGEHMSRAVVLGWFDKMGITRDAATPADVERLLHDLGLGLNVFVGRIKSKVIMQELRRKLDLAHKG